MPPKHIPVFEFLTKNRCGINIAEQGSPASSSAGTSGGSNQWPMNLGDLATPTESPTSVPTNEAPAPSIRRWKKPKKKPKPTPNAEDNPNVEDTLNAEDTPNVEDTLAEMVGKGKKKRGGKRGIVTTAVSQAWNRQHKRKMQLNWDAKKKTIVCELGEHHLMMDIGSIARSDIPMAGAWTDMTESERLVFWDSLTALYDFPQDPDASRPLVVRIETEAKDKYSEWKNECKTWWTWYEEEEVKKGNDPKLVTPKEFQTRPNEWLKLRDYWNSTIGKARSAHGKKAREGHDLITRGGSRPMHEYAESFKSGNTAESQSPYCNAGMKCFPIDDPHTPTKIRGLKFLAAQKDYFSTLASTQELGGDAPPLTPMDEEALEIDAITKYMGKSQGQFQSGIGKKRPISGFGDIGGSSSVSAASLQRMDHLSRLVEDQQQSLSQMAEERKESLKTQQALAAKVDALMNLLQSQGHNLDHI